MHRIILIISLGAFCAAWLYVANAMPGDSFYVRAETTHADQVIRGLERGKGYWDIALLDPEYPPAYYLLAVGSARLVGNCSRIALALPNLILYLALLLLVWKIASFYFPAGIGFFSVVYTGVIFFPYAYQRAAEMMLLFSVAWFVFACVLLLRRDEWPFFLLLAAATASCFLSKQTAPVYLVGPVAWVYWERRTQRRPRFFVKLAGSLVLGGLIAYLAFYRALPISWLVENVLSRSVREGSVPLGSTHMPTRVAWFFILTIKTFFVPICLFVMVRIKAPRAGRAPMYWLLAIALIPHVFLSFFNNKWEEYIMPVYPFVALGLIGGLEPVWSKKNWRTLCALFLIAGMLVPVYGAAQTAAFRIAAYRERAATFNALTQAMRKDFPKVTVTLFAPGYSYQLALFINDLALEKDRPFLLQQPNPQSHFQDLAVLIRNPLNLRSDVCYSRQEYAHWQKKEPQGAALWAERIDEFIEQYRPVQTFGADNRDDTMALVLCRKKVEEPPFEIPK